MNAYSTELLVRDHHASLEAQAARDRRRRELGPRPIGRGIGPQLAAPVIAVASAVRGLRTHRTHLHATSPASD